MLDSQQFIPFVAATVGQLEGDDLKKVTKFLQMLSVVSQMTPNEAIDLSYRIDFHHELLAPQPQLFPSGYSISTIQAALKFQPPQQEIPDDEDAPPVIKTNEVKDYAIITFNDTSYDFDISQEAQEFLSAVDHHFVKICQYVDPRLKKHFDEGLKKFNEGFNVEIAEFHEKWCAFEKLYLEKLNEIHGFVFRPVSEIVEIECKLTEAEERGNIAGKQKYEAEFVDKVIVFAKQLWPSLELLDPIEKPLKRHVVALAEGTLHYESALKKDEWLHIAKHCIKEYMELRLLFADAPTKRLSPEFKENELLCQSLQQFYHTIAEGAPVWDFVDCMPAVIQVKSDQWLTKNLVRSALLLI